MRTNFFAIIFSVIFFVVGLLTLPHYGINWDTINHLPRGQAYLHYFLTGKQDFSDLPTFKPYFQKPDTIFISSDIPKEKIPRRSMYQSDGTTFTWFMDHDGVGHPPLSDILSSLFNRVFFQNLRIINDIDSYRIYSILLSSLLVGLVFLWSSKVYGGFAAFIAVLSLVLYPLFWSESHFNNEKDIPETVYFSYMLFSIWFGIVYRDWRWILLFGVFFGLGMGTKFNILFSAPLIGFWLFIYLLHKFKNKINFGNFLRNGKVIFTMLAAPFLGIAIFFASWPYLWPDPVSRIAGVINFYKTLGLTMNKNPDFIGPLGFNTYPVQTVIYTTPLIILFFAIIGIVAAFYRLRYENDKVSLLFLLWLFIPLIRVSIPGTNIYGGLRQIMEYLPALSILSGLGAIYLRDFLGKYLKHRKVLIGVLITCSFLPITFKLVQIHPNENVYFNPLIGGLKGAKDREFPFWGNSFGAAYRQGVNWLNQNAQENSNLVLVYEHHPNIATIWLRPDITLQNRNRSGYLRLGEYAMTLSYQGSENRSYFDMYLNRLVNPVYEVNVDGVSILKIWRNDEAHLKDEFRTEEQDKNVVVATSPTGFTVDLGQLRAISRLEIEYAEERCEALKAGYVEISRDKIRWESLPGILPKAWRVSFLGEQPSNGKFIEPFVGQKIRFVRFVLSPANTCLKNVKSIKVYYFKESL